MRARFARLKGTLPRAYWYVWWGTLVNRLGGFVIPLLTIYLIEVRKVSVSEAGGIVSIFGAGSVLASIVGGQLSDRLGRRITMVLSMFGGAIAMTVLGLVRDLTAIAAMCGVVGFVGELYRPAVLAFVADVVPPAQRVHAYGLLHWVINIGFAFALIIGGLLAEVDFTLLFFADAATMAIYGVIVLVAVPETRPAMTREARAAQPPARSWLRDGPFVVFILLILAMTLLPFQSGATLSAHMTYQGFTPGAYGAAMAVNGVLIILIQPRLSTWAARHDPSRVLVGSALLYGIGISMHGLATELWMHAIAVIVWTFAEIIEGPTRSTIVAALAPPDARGRYQGAVVMSFAVAQLVSPKLGTWTWEHQGPAVVWLASLALGICVAAGLAATARSRRRRLAEVTAPSPTGSS